MRCKPPYFKDAREYLDFFMGYNCPMYWINEKDRKYYRARVARDLTGQLGVSKEFGSLSTARARRMFTPVTSPCAGLEELERIGKDRIRHGYRVMLDPLEQLLKAGSLN